MWRIKWVKDSELDRPTSAVEALGECNQALFPNNHKLLKILATLPVSKCTSDSTGQETLNGLALMLIFRTHIHDDSMIEGISDDEDSISLTAHAENLQGGEKSSSEYSSDDDVHRHILCSSAFSKNRRIYWKHLDDFAPSPPRVFL
ncbi:unnamed protein product [Parnassius apollo]|uniref:(apollo) hypothetical protein n=1 Tax=Parnassius apollo TaxID=110799 RepID=A0A8S3X8Y6_PARAO|nr:unnamed protein product [Parnassius apollo]